MFFVDIERDMKSSVTSVKWQKKNWENLRHESIIALSWARFLFLSNFILLRVRLRWIEMWYRFCWSFFLKQQSSRLRFLTGDDFLRMQQRQYGIRNVHNLVWFVCDLPVYELMTCQRSTFKKYRLMLTTSDAATWWFVWSCICCAGNMNIWKGLTRIFARILVKSGFIRRSRETSKRNWKVF